MMCGCSPVFGRITKNFAGSWERETSPSEWPMKWRRSLIPDSNKRKDNSRFHWTAELRGRSEMRQREHLTDRLRYIRSGRTVPSILMQRTKNLVVQNTAFVSDIRFDR